MNTNIENNVDNNKNRISVDEYLNNKELLELTYIPFDTKLQIVSHVINGVVNSIGGLNTSLLRRISTEVFIEAITNIDMNAVVNDLKGYDQLKYHDKLDDLIAIMGNEYEEFQRILNERVNDYIRIETNPAVTINGIYEQIKTYLNTFLDYVNKYIQNIDVDKVMQQFAPLIEKVGDANEG